MLQVTLQDLAQSLHAAPPGIAVHLFGGASNGLNWGGSVQAQPEAAHQDPRRQPERGHEGHRPRDLALRYHARVPVRTPAALRGAGCSVAAGMRPGADGFLAALLQPSGMHTSCDMCTIQCMTSLYIADWGGHDSDMTLACRAAAWCTEPVSQRSI